MIFAQAMLVAAAVAAASPALAQPLPTAIASGIVGERFDGYIGIAAGATPEVRRQVTAINIKRRSLYIQLASGRNATAEMVGLATACELFRQLPVGSAYLLKDGVWRRRAAGEAAPQPDYCR